MPYTLWSHGRLLGETELEYARYAPLNRGGGFWPTVIGSKLMPVVTGVTAASIELATKSRGLERSTAPKHEDSGDLTARIHESTEYADYLAAIDRLNALDLELHDPEDNVVPAEWIDIRDLDFLSDLQARDLEADDEVALPEPYDPEIEEAVAHDLHVLGFERDPRCDEPFLPHERSDDKDLARRPFPLYQIHVRLLDESAIP
jgi:hypothetical protein